MMNRINFVSFLVILIICRNCFAQQKFIGFSGNNNTTGSSVLAAVTLEPIANNQNNFDAELAFKTIAVGASDIGRGSNNALLYWKNGKFWRFSQGKYRQLNIGSDTEMPRNGNINIVELPSPMASEVGLIIFWHTASDCSRKGESALGLWNYEGPYTQSETEVREVLGGITPTSFLIRISRFDLVGREVARNLAIASIPSLVSEEPVKEEVVNSLFPGVTEVNSSAATSNGLIALQGYNEKEKIFRFGILDPRKKQINWLPIPLRNGSSQYFKRSFEQSKAFHIEWSPSGRYLAISDKIRRLIIWDNKEKMWLMDGNQLRTVNVDANAPWCWLDDSQIIWTEQFMLNSTFLHSQSIDRENAKRSDLGTIKGVTIKQLFPLDAAPISESKAKI